MVSRDKIVTKTPLVNTNGSQLVLGFQDFVFDRFYKSESLLKFFLPIELDIVRLKATNDAPQVPKTTPFHYPLAYLLVCTD